MHNWVSGRSLPHDGDMRSEHLQLNPAFPLCWESIETLRIGFETAQVRLHEPTPQEQRFIGKLSEGVRTRELRDVARKCGLADADRLSLLQQLERVLVRGTVPTTDPRPPNARRTGAPGSTDSATPDILVLGDGAFAAQLQTHLARAGVSAAHTATARQEEAEPSASSPIPSRFAIVIERFLGAAAVPHALFSSGIPHFPICLTDSGMFAGPLVLPAEPPCLACVELHRTDAEPTIAVLAAQITKVAPAAETPACAELAASLALLAFRQWQAGAPGAPAVRLRFPVQDGMPVFAPSAETVSPHPECGCSLYRGQG